MENQEITIYGEVLRVSDPKIIVGKETGKEIKRQDILLRYSAKYVNELSICVINHNCGRVAVGDFVKAKISLESHRSKTSDNYFTIATAFQITKITNK